MHLFSLFLFLYQNSFLPVKSTKVLKHSYQKHVRIRDEAYHKIVTRESIFSPFFLFRNLKKDRPFSIKLRASKDGCSLNVISISEEHNQEKSEVITRAIF